MQYSQCKQKWDPSPLPRVGQPRVHTVPQTAHTVTKHRVRDSARASESRGMCDLQQAGLCTTPNTPKTHPTRINQRLELCTWQRSQALITEFGIVSASSYLPVDTLWGDKGVTRKRTTQDRLWEKNQAEEALTAKLHLWQQRSRLSQEESLRRTEPAGDKTSWAGQQQGLLSTRVIPSEKAAAGAFPARAASLPLVELSEMLLFSAETNSTN